VEEVTRVYELPYPPSVNHYWRRVGARTLISRQGRLYRGHVQAMLAVQRVRPIDGRLAVVIDVLPPDQRPRDLDNVQKGLLDALEAGGAYMNDSQIDLLITRRGMQTTGGMAHVRLERLPVSRCPLCEGAWTG